jgi:hypothetical protein
MQYKIALTLSLISCATPKIKLNHDAPTSFAAAVVILVHQPTSHLTAEDPHIHAHQPFAQIASMVHITTPMAQRIKKLGTSLVACCLPPLDVPPLTLTPPLIFYS